MSTQQQQLTVTKLAYAAGVADTVTSAGLAKWASEGAYNDGVHAVASRMAFDPAVHETNSKLAGEVAEVFIKLAMAMEEEDEKEKEKDPEAAKKKERQEYMAEMTDEKEKKATLAYWALCDKAQSGAVKIAAAMQGENPGTGDSSGNSLSDAAAADSLAAIDERHRPAGYAAGAPDKELGAEVGKKTDHPTKENIGKTAASILAELTKEAAAQQGENPGTGDSSGNSLSDAAAADSLAAIDERHRPAGYAAGAPDKELGAEIGNKSEHPTKENIGKTAKERFEETVKQAAMHPVFEKLTREEKIAHCRTMSDLPFDQRKAYLKKLSTRK